MMVKGYYELPENSADVVFVGSSGVYRFWQPAFGFKEEGIASTAFATSTLPGFCVREVTEEVLKTQSPKVLVVSPTMFLKVDDLLENRIYFLSMNMRPSKTRFHMLGSFCDYLGTPYADRLRFYLPFLQFHSVWNEFFEGSFRRTIEPLLNSCYQGRFLEGQATGISHSATPDWELPVDERLERALRDYLDYCRGLDTEVIFYEPPIWESEGRAANSAYIKKIIQEYGFEVIDFGSEENYRLLKLDEDSDIMDGTHTNVRGSYKFSKVFAKMLKDRYDLPDRREDPTYQDWVVKAEQYYEITEPYMQEEQKEDGE
ncbi:MAG: D-alanyl-lipoteichoic acid biosynthesis protein DltD [Lachnospiraceae bacterium]|nr:D-alanyl-lipoteichoic acid biosynthesis protein DltD [Lachnospiraceae bacterium]